MTATVTPDLLETRFPEVADRDDLQDHIDEAIEEISQVAWGDRYNTGVMYLAMHLITLRARGEAAAAASGAAAGGGSIQGAVKWEAAGPLQRGFADPRGQVKGQTDTDAWFNSTTYGQRYKSLRELIFADRVL